ncbi:ABC-2 type transport system permease protein [Nocardia caishijiensis]|uniref:ABC-2 type transport system permease protein n=2 Tax=Nocardia caishijiensis TaxID=184756 RepID=A0ABQ6YW45_9NOCA|nr:ABC-2 type transport system permease protein [Nocardia caishijiensis]
MPAAAARPESVSDQGDARTEESPVHSDDTPTEAEVADVAAAEQTADAPLLVKTPMVSDSQTFRRAFKDMRDGFGQRELWLSLGWQDIKQRYRRSVLGPFWITIATGLQALAMGLLYSTLLNQPISEYLPYVTIGLIIWNVINASIIEGADVFIANEGLIKQLPSALSVHVYRLVWRQFLFFVHNVAIYALLVVVFALWRNLDVSVLLAIPAIGLLFLNAMWVTIVFGIFATRYRDIAPILGSMTLMLFVLTPVMWSTKALETAVGGMSDRAKLIEIVPTFHYLEIVRAPLLGEPSQWHHWAIVGAITVVGWAVAILALKQYRARVPYWV